MTTKAEFEAFVQANASRESRLSPRKESDVNYRYECYDDADGNEVAFISWRDGAATYTIRDDQ